MDGVKINIMEMWDGVKWSGLEGMEGNEPESDRMEMGGMGLKRFLKGNVLIVYPTDSLARRKKQISGSSPTVQRLSVA